MAPTHPSRNPGWETTLGITGRVRRRTLPSLTRRPPEAARTPSWHRVWPVAVASRGAGESCASSVLRSRLSQPRLEGRKPHQDAVRPPVEPVCQVNQAGRTQQRQEVDPFAPVPILRVPDLEAHAPLPAHQPTRTRSDRASRRPQRPLAGRLARAGGGRTSQGDGGQLLLTLRLEREWQDRHGIALDCPERGWGGGVQASWDH